MPGIGFTFQDTDFNNNSSGGKAWLVIFIVVALVTVGVVFLVRYLGSGQKTAEASGEEKTEEPTPASSAPPAETGTAPAASPAPSSAQTEAARPVARLPEIKNASDKVLAFIKAGEEAEKADDYYAARTNYLAALADPGCGNARELAEARLGAVDIELIFSPREMPGKIDYAIASGDSLKKIANKHGTTVDLIVKGNSVPNPDRVQIGDRLRVLDKQEFAITVSKSRNDLLVTLNGEFFKRYTVGTGKFSRTPIGTFKIEDKIPNPPWWRPDGKVVPFGDKENILGTRWMAIAATGTTPPAKGYGIHGTWDDTSLGQQSSAGCVRMNNGDVEELFTYVPLGTPVTIVE